MTVENLTCLPNLKVKPRLHTCINFSASATQLLTSKEEQALDLSYNLINFVPPTELPPSILYLTTEGNPLLQMNDDAWMEVYDALPELRQHDCEDVYDTASEDDEDDEGAEGGGAKQESAAAVRGAEEEEETDEEDGGLMREEEKLALLSRLMGGHAALMQASQVHALCTRHYVLCRRPYALCPMS
eukprot:80127-Rhodomonas_salina.1